MKTFFKFFACSLVIGTAVSLQGYVLENRDPGKITVCTTETYPHSKEQTIPIQSAVVSWIYKSVKEIPPVKNFWLVTLQPGQKVEIILGKNRESCDVEIIYEQKGYNAGSTKWGLLETFSANEAMFFVNGSLSSLR